MTVISNGNYELNVNELDAVSGASFFGTLIRLSGNVMGANAVESLHIGDLPVDPNTGGGRMLSPFGGN
jgi:hypothetical protein